jgi:hypothetical protein
MFNRHAMADAACALLLEKARIRLTALFAEYGTFDASELPRAVQSEIFRRAIIESAAANFPTSNLQLLSHGLKSFDHPAFVPAWERMRLATEAGRDAFAMTTGVYAAIVLAGYGLPVSPFDLMTTRILAEPSNDIDTVLGLFSADQGAFVGYNSAAAPFYVLVTDCIRTLRQRTPTCRELSEVKQLFERNGASLPPDPGQLFVPGMAVVPRRPGDTISTVALHDPNPTAGSVALYAGWQVDGESYGAPNDGYVPVPVQLLHAVVHDPAIAYSLSWPVASPPAIH